MSILIRIVWRDAKCTGPEGDRDGSSSNAARDAVPDIVMSYDELVALPLDEEQAFVLMFVDGRASAETIARLAGLPVAVVGSIVDDLADLGAVELHSPSGRPS
jgi:hypothetical protein